MREVLENEPNLRIKQAEVAALAYRRRPSGGSAGCICATGGGSPRGDSDRHHRDIPEWPGACRARSSTVAGGMAKRRRSFLGDQLRTLGLGLDAAENRHAAAAGRPHHRLVAIRAAAGRCGSDAIFVSDREDRPAADSVPHRATRPRRRTRILAGGDSAFAAVQRANRGRWAAILPVDRRQGRQIPG